MNPEEQTTDLPPEEIKTEPEEATVKIEPPDLEETESPVLFVQPKTRGRKPKRGRRGRPSLRGGKSQCDLGPPIKDSPAPPPIETKDNEEAEEFPSQEDDMTGKNDKRKLVDTISDSPKPSSVKRVGPRKNKLGYKKRQSDAEVTTEENPTPIKKIKKAELLDDDPAEEVDLEDMMEPPQRGKGRKGRGKSLERASPLPGRKTTRMGSVSPALSKDGLSESSNDSSGPRGRTRLKNRDEDEEIPKHKGPLRGKGRARVSSGSPLSVGSTSTKSDGSARQLTIPEIPKKSSKEEGDPQDEQKEEVDFQSVAQKAKKKKKHFKGLRYSFGVKKKTKPKPKTSLSTSMVDSPLESDSLISEEVDADSLDSMSIETSSLPNPTADPYDPTDEFNDSPTAVSEPIPLQHHRQRSSGTEGQDEEWEEPEAEVEEDEEAVEEEQQSFEGEEYQIPESTEYIPPEDLADSETLDTSDEAVQYEFGEEYKIPQEDQVEDEQILEGEEYHFAGDSECEEEAAVDVPAEGEDEHVAEEEEGVVQGEEEEEEGVVQEEEEEEEEVVQDEEAEQPSEEQVQYYEDPPSPEEELQGEAYVVPAEAYQEPEEYEEEYVEDETPAYDEVHQSEPQEDDPEYEPTDDVEDEQMDNYEDEFGEEEVPQMNGVVEQNGLSDTEEMVVADENALAEPTENGYASPDGDDHEMAVAGTDGAGNISALPVTEEDSNDTSDASGHMKELNSLGALQGSGRRVSKRRTKVNDRFADSADDKDITRKSKRISQSIVSSSHGLTIAPRNDGKGYSKMVEEKDQDVANEELNDVLCKCRVVRNPKAVNLVGDVYCQAMDCFDGRIIGCSNIVTQHTFLRAANKIPFSLLCTIHRQRLRRHNCCPGCGLFCTQGVFNECRWDKLGSRHYYHKLCGLIINGASFCPHCGTDQPPVLVNLELKLNRKPVVYLKQHQEKKEFISSARMSCPKTDGSVQPSSDPDSKVPVNAPFLELPNGRIIHATKLADGIEKERIEGAIETIKKGKSFNVKLSAKAIYWACKYNDLEKLMYVLVNGLNPNVKVKEYGNQTGLHTASMHGCVAALHVLVLAGASLDPTDSQLLTPLMVAIIRDFNDVVNYLVQAGASLQAKTQDGMTCLHLAAKMGNYSSCKHILDSGRLTRHTINIQDEGGWTPLVWASENRCVTVVKILLDSGADPQICDVEQNTALHWAAYSGSTHICSMVLEKGCSLRSMNGIGDTPLHIAARQNHLDAVVQLLARGSSLDICNTRGQTPLDCCIPDSQCFLHMTLSKSISDVIKENGLRTEKILSSDIACGKEAVPISCVNGVDDDGLPKNYVYISENCEALNVNIDRTISSLKYCECVDGCNSDSCVCSQLNFQCWYDPEGRLLANFNYIDPPMIFECNRACGCNKLSCHNRVVQHGMTSHMQLFKTQGKGWGVRALKDIEKGSYVCEYVGEIITDLEADQREDDSYLFDLDNRDSETFCIDARQYANVARFINHLCEPNLTPVKVFIDHQDLIFPRIAFFANRLIQADEELGFDYGEKFWVIKYKQFTCTCGINDCKYSSQTIHQTLENYNKKIQMQQQQENPKVLDA